MKTSIDRFTHWLAALAFGGCLIPASLTAQEMPQGPHAPPPPPAGREMLDKGPVPERKIQRQRLQMEMRRRMGMRQEAGRMEMKARDGMGPGPMRDARPMMRVPKRNSLPGDRMSGPSEAGPPAKIRHLREAAEHLQAAGYPDYADKARKEADRITEQVQRESAKVADPQLAEMVGKLAREVEELRQQVRRMNAEMAPKPPKDKNETEELRQQIRRLKAELGARPPKDHDERPAPPAGEVRPQ